jgi:hypothetical protein
MAEASGGHALTLSPVRPPPGLHLLQDENVLPLQPLMLKMLIQNGGWASTRDIASSFLAQDDSQIDYYAEITKRMPGKVLGRHNLVEREGD